MGRLDGEVLFEIGLGLPVLMQVAISGAGGAFLCLYSFIWNKEAWLFAFGDRERYGQLPHNRGGLACGRRRRVACP